MSIFVTSDTHFNHKRILELSERPFKDIDHHDISLVNNWNSVVEPDDTVIHLGDVALGPWPVGLDCVNLLNGYKILVPGNHDRIASFEKDARRERFMPDYESVFDKILDEVAAITIQGVGFLVSHYPYTGDSHDGDRFTDIRAVDMGIPLIHGHNHVGAGHHISFTPRGTLQIAVGVDAHNYTPVHEDKIIQWYKENR